MASSFGCSFPITCKGMPADQLEHIFEPFVTFRHKGLGLGLAISRSIVLAHEGTIRA